MFGGGFAAAAAAAGGGLVPGQGMWLEELYDPLADPLASPIRPGSVHTINTEASGMHGGIMLRPLGPLPGGMYLI